MRWESEGSFYLCFCPTKEQPFEYFSRFLFDKNICKTLAQKQRFLITTQTVMQGIHLIRNQKYIPH